MENHLGPIRDDEEMELPPGFRFHPTDEELITHYLSLKVIDSSFCAKAIGEVDFNKVEPWDLPWRAKMGEREFYFFCVKDRKYPTGLRTNRATDAGYWKATGKDKEIYRGKNLVGMKKTLVFYKGRAPKGEKTNWVMHEYRLEGNNSPYNFPGTPKNEWVISRIFHKSSGGKKLHISSLAMMSSHRNEVHPSNLPPLKECSAYDDHTRSTTVDASHLTYLSDPTEENKPLEDMVDSFNNSFLFPKISVSESIFPTQFVPNFENLQYPDCGMVEDQSMLRFLVRNDGFLEAKLSPETGMSTEISSVLSGHETGQRVEDPVSSVGPADLDCFWNY